MMTPLPACLCLSSLVGDGLLTERLRQYAGEDTSLNGSWRWSYLFPHPSRFQRDTFPQGKALYAQVLTERLTIERINLSDGVGLVTERLFQQRW